MDKQYLKYLKKTECVLELRNVGYHVPMGHRIWGTSDILPDFPQKTMFRYTQLLKSNKSDLNLFMTLKINYSTLYIVVHS